MKRTSKAGELVKAVCTLLEGDQHASLRSGATSKDDWSKIKCSLFALCVHSPGEACSVIVESADESKELFVLGVRLGFAYSFIRCNISAIAH